MKIYTKTGDTGETGLANGQRCPKSDLLIAAVGALDEYSAAVGVLLAVPVDHEAADRALLTRSQGNALFIGAVVAGAHTASLTRHAALNQADVIQLEARIDQLEATLAPLRQFIVPGGTPAAAQAHLTRTVCRRAERQLAAVRDQIESTYWPLVLAYVNRLSDYLFVLARSYNHWAGVDDIGWGTNNVLS